MGRSFQFISVAVCALITFTTGSSHAGFATSVIEYSPGIGIPTMFQDSDAALGMPEGDTSFGVLTPFNAAFLGSHIVGIGQGGRLTLALGAAAPTGAGAAIGVHAAVGIIDTDWPNGNAGPVATLYTNPRTAEVLVSDDGDRWHSLGQQTFEMPTNFYSAGVTTPGYQEEPGTTVADFTKPLTASLSDFNGRAWPGILTLLDGSAGGTWLDLTNAPYPFVSFVRFDVTGAEQSMYVDAVAVIPEPAAAAGLLLACAILIRGRAGVR